MSKIFKNKKSAALILAGVLACSTPLPVMASTDTEVVESSDVDSLVSIVRKVLDANIDESALRDDVNSVYNKLKDMGVTKEDAKGLLAKMIDFVKGLFE